MYTSPPRKAVSEHVSARREKVDAARRQRLRGSYKVNTNTEEVSNDLPGSSFAPKIRWNKKVKTHN